MIELTDSQKAKLQANLERDMFNMVRTQYGYLSCLTNSDLNWLCNKEVGESKADSKVGKVKEILYKRYGMDNVERILKQLKIA